MKPGRDTRSLLIVVLSVALFGWLARPSPSPPPGPPHGHPPGGPPGPFAGLWHRLVHRPLAAAGVVKGGDPGSEPGHHGGPWGAHGHGPGHEHGEEGEGRGWTVLAADDPLLRQARLERMQPWQPFTMAVRGAGSLVVRGVGRGPQGQPAPGGLRSLSEGRFTFASHDGDLVEDGTQGHVEAVRRIPRDSHAVSISPAGHILAFHPSRSRDAEECVYCGTIDLATSAGWGRPGLQGLGTLAVQQRETHPEDRPAQGAR